MIEIKTKATYSPFKGLKSIMPSLTIPNQTMPLKTLLERHARGMPITGYDVHNEVYYPDDTPIDFKTWDLTEREDYVREHAQQVRDLKTKYETEQKAKQSEKAKKEAQTHGGQTDGTSQAATPSGELSGAKSVDSTAKKEPQNQ